MSSLVVALCHFCEQHGPNIVFYSRCNRKENEIAPKSSKCINCVACSPLDRGHPGFISKDPGLNLVISSSDKNDFPNHSQLQQACFRSLSSEVYPTKEGPVFFCDMGIGIHVVSHTFFLKDSSARGFQRWFSVIVSAPENAILLRSWSCLISELKAIITDLQQMAACVYEQEEEHYSHRILRSSLHSSSIGTARSLQDLTGNPAVFLLLHQRFSSVIQLLSNTYKVFVDVRKPLTTIVGKEYISTLVQISHQLGSENLCKVIWHLLLGGMYSIASDNFIVRENYTNALHLLLPIKLATRASSPSSQLKNNNSVCLLVTSTNHRIVCKWDEPTQLSKAPSLVTRYGQILLADEVPELSVLQQLTSAHEELLNAAKKYQMLQKSDPNKVLQFFHSLGYDRKDIDILHYWNLYLQTNSIYT